MKLEELRKQKNNTQAEIANLIGISQSNYSKYEIEKTTPDIKSLITLADYYGVSLDYLCDHETEQLDISYYSPTAKEIIKKLPLLNNSNLIKLDSVCDGLILGQ